MITYKMVKDSLFDYKRGRREFDDPNMNKLMQDKELLQEYLNGYDHKDYRYYDDMRSMFRTQYLPGVEEAKYDELIGSRLSSMTKEDIKTRANALVPMFCQAIAFGITKVLDILLTHVDLKILRRDFLIADDLQSRMMLSYIDKDRREKFLGTLRVFLNHGIDIVEFFDDSFIFNVLPEFHQELMNAGYDYSEYMSTKYLNTKIGATTITINSHKYKRALAKEHKQVIIDEFLSS